MADPFVGEIRLMSFVFPPKGWALCNGQILGISGNQALFSLLGTTYGGNGTTNFGLPDLRGRVPIHVGNGHTAGERAGEAAHTISTAELPTHQHTLRASSANGNNAVATGNILGSVSGLYGPPASLTSMEPSSVSTVGGSQPHENMQPFLTLSFCISLDGIFPSPS